MVVPSLSPRVSVILPVYNGASTVGDAIGSIRAQIFPAWELIVVDDGSTDDSAAIARAAAGEDSRIRCVRCAHDGIVAALNAGMATAAGQYLARMDADDVALPERLGEQVALLDRSPELGLVGCLVDFGGDRTANAGYALHVDWINSLVSPAEIELNRFVESPFAHPSVMFRRELVTQFGGYGAGEFPEDYELWLRWIDAGVRMAKVPRVLLRWNDPPARLSRTDARYSPERFFATKAAWIARELSRRGLLEGAVHPALGSRGDGPTVETSSASTEGPRPVWIWGAGRPTRKRAAHLEVHGVRIAGYIDVDRKKTGRQLAGVPVVGVESMPAPGTAFVLGYVSSRGARELIRATLRAAGHIEGRDFLMCA